MERGNGILRINTGKDENSMANEQKKDYSKLVKGLQIATGVVMLACVVLGVYFINKYNIKVSNIKNLSEMKSREKCLSRKQGWISLSEQFHLALRMK